MSKIDLAKERIFNLKDKQKPLAANIKQLESTIFDLQNQKLSQEVIAPLQKALDEARSEYDSIKDELAELDKATYEAAEAERKSAKSEFISILNKSHTAYISVDAKYILIKDLSKTEKLVNLVEFNLDWKRLLSTFAMEASRPDKFDNFSEYDIRNLFIESGRAYNVKTSSFNEPKWDDLKVFNILNVQKQYWAPINLGEDYSPFFDDLMYSLGGGKLENIEHLEKWAAFKYLYPEKHKTIPGLNITGKPGGNGKGLYQTILKSIFNPIGVTETTSKALNGGFNKQFEGKIILILDDEKKDGFPNSQLKAGSGNTSQVIEPKGIDAYSVDATSNWIIADNTGLVQLSGGGTSGEDRRWSIIDTEITLLEHLTQKYSIELDDAKAIAEVMGNLFEDRIECGKWVAAMITKHKVRDMKVIMPLHGVDYQQRLEDQKDIYSTIFDEILPIFKKQHIFPANFLKEIVESKTGKTINQTTLTKKFKEYLSRNKVKEIESAKDLYINILWKGNQTGDKIRRTAYRTHEGKTLDIKEFEYADIANEPWSKNSKLTLQSIEIAVYDDDDGVFAGLQKTVATVATVAVKQNTYINQRLTTPNISDSFSDSLKTPKTVAVNIPKIHQMLNDIKRNGVDYD